jgi:hypothetical protein
MEAILNKLVRVTLLVLCTTVPSSIALAQNLLTNPNFNQNISGWTAIPAGTATWDATDIDASPSSGSARVTNSGSQAQFQQCVAVSPGAKYDLIAHMRIPSGQAGTGAAFIAINYYASAGCSGASRGSSSTSGVSETGRWLGDSLFARPSINGDALSAMVSLVVTRTTGSTFAAQFDSIQFGPAGSFTQRLVIPVAASVTGANNSAFRSDVWLLNHSKNRDIPVKLTLYCYANSACTSVEKTLTVPARWNSQQKDIVTSLFAQAQVGGAIEIEYDSALGTISATSRLYSPATGPTYGFAMVARPADQGLTRAVFPGLGWNGGVLTSGFRTNLGFYNPNATTANVTIELHRGDGSVLGTTSASVPSRRAQQINNLFGAVGASTVVATDAYAIVISDVPIFSYVSVLDNGSSDGSYAEGLPDEQF